MSITSPFQFVMQGSFFAHRALMRDTRLLNELANRIDTFSKDQVRQLRHWYEFYWNMMEQHHHAEDEILFLEVEKRLDAPSEIIEAMEVEHNRLRFLIDEIKRLLGEVQRAAPTPPKLRDELNRYTSELLSLFISHIGKEERYIYENMTIHFTPAEQQRMEERVKRKAPMSYLSYMIPWLHDSLNEEEKQQLDSNLPWTAKLLNRFFWQSKYERIMSPVKALV